MPCSGDARRCYRCGAANKRRTNIEDRATLPMEAGCRVSQWKDKFFLQFVVICHDKYPIAKVQLVCFRISCLCLCCMRISQSRAVPWPQSIQKISQISQLQIAENFTVQLKSLMSKSLNAWIERNIHTIHHTGTILMYGDSNAWMGRKSPKFYAVYYYY